MRKILMIVFAGVFGLPHLCDSYVSMEAKVEKHKVESGATTCTIPADGMPSGVYQVTLIENGTVTGTKKFTK